MKSEPFKLTKMTAPMAVQGSFLADSFAHYSVHDFHNLLQTWVVLSPERCHSPPTFSSVWKIIGLFQVFWGHKPLFFLQTKCVSLSTEPTPLRSLSKTIFDSYRVLIIDTNTNQALARTFQYMILLY
ncbi:hypothetical protein Hanom_Chr15g01402711 [Helianthus anomalus]